MISAEQWAEIRRLFYAEHWNIGTIAAAVGVHADTVRRAIGAANFRSDRPRVSKLDPFVPFIRETLERYPRLRATRLHQMLRARGFQSESCVQLRRLVKILRPRSTAEAYLRLSVMPGEQAQVDWGSFGWIGEGRQRRALSCFVMVLSWSRALHAVFTLDQSLESFLRGHVEAFDHFGGVPRTLLYDNLKSVVLERRAAAIHFNPRILEFAGHYHFDPRPVAVARGNEKGRVERQIQYLRTSFFAARPFSDVDDLNAQFKVWREGTAHVRPCPQDKDLSVAAALAKEREYLLSPPEHPFETDFVDTVRSGKTPYLQFDRNAYSIPHTLARKPLTLVASATLIRIFDGPQKEVARHLRSYGSSETIEDPGHIEALARQKQAARESRGRDRLLALVPQTQTLFEVLALRGENMGGETSRLLRLLDDYGPDEVQAAVEDAVSREAFSASAVAHVLEQRRRSRGLSPPVSVELPQDPRVRDLRVTPHNLEDYDALGKLPDDDQ